jgi:hypothetical protein
MSSFAAYLLGFAILILGLAFAAFLLNVPGLLIVGGAIVLGGIVLAVATRRGKSTTSTSGRKPPS